MSLMICKCCFVGGQQKALSLYNIETQWIKNDNHYEH